MSEHWPSRPLGEVSTKIGSGSTPRGGSEAYKATGTPLIRSMNVHFDGVRDEGLAFLDEDQARFLEGVAVRADDVLLNITGASIGRVATAPRRLAGARVNQHVCIIRPAPALDSRFLAAFLASPDQQALIMAEESGATRQALTKAKLEAWEVPVPPLDEQRRIVAKVDALRARSRRAKDALDVVPALLDRLRQSILAGAFRGDLTADWREQNPDVEPASELLKRTRVERRKRWEESELARMRAKGKPPKDDRWKAKYVEPEPVDEGDLPELPEGWCWSAGEDVTTADIVYGIVQPGPEVLGGVPYVRGLDIQDGQILVEQLHRTSEAIARRYERASIRAGDVLLGIIRATKVAVVPPGIDGANITQGTARFRPAREVATDYLAMWLDSPFAQDWLHAHYRGIDMPGLNLADVRRVPIPLCSGTEQTALVARLRLAMSKWRTLREAATTTEAALTGLDRAILAAAFRGDLLDRQPDNVSVVQRASL